jgi:hypothetical protein
MVEGGCWDLELLSSHSEKSITQDEAVSDAQEGSTEIVDGDSQSLSPKLVTTNPHASEWLAKYENAVVDNMRTVSSNGSSSSSSSNSNNQSKCRARECVLRQGTPVAVLGHLKERDGALWISVMSDGLRPSVISNKVFGRKPQVVPIKNEEIKLPKAEVVPMHVE